MTTSGFRNPEADRIWNDHLGNNEFVEHKKQCAVCSTPSMPPVLCPAGSAILSNVIVDVTSAIDDVLRKEPMPNPETPEPDNVIPENELAHRRRVLQLSEEIVDLFKDLIDRASEYRDLGVPTREWLPLVTRNVPESVRKYIDHPLQRALIPALIDVTVRAARGEPFKFDPFKDLDLKGASHYDEADDDESDDDESPPIAGIAGLIAPIAKMLFGGDKTTDSYNFSAPALQLLDEINEQLDAAPKVKETDAPALEAILLLRGAAGPAQGALSRTKSPGVFRMLSPGQFGGKQCLIESYFTYEDIVSFALIRPVEAKSTLFTS